MIPSVSGKNIQMTSPDNRHSLTECRSSALFFEIETEGQLTEQSLPPVDLDCVSDDESWLMIAL